MGGGYYGGADDVAPATRAASAATVFENKSINSDLNPLGRELKCETKNAVCVAIDVTGTMGAWTEVLWKKMPMFFGQICVQGYLENPSMTFAAVGDATHDRAPFQVTPFAVGADIDTALGKMYLEGGGGSSWEESYELAAYFFARHCNVASCVRKPFLFITGDEMFYDSVKRTQILKVLGRSVDADVPAQRIFEECLEKFEVFLVHKPNEIVNAEKQCLALWRSTIGKHRVLFFEDPNAIVDVMLGAIAIASGSRTLTTYLADMRAREQTTERMEIVASALGPYAAVAAEVKSATPAKTAAAPAKTETKEAKSDAAGGAAASSSSSSSSASGAGAGAGAATATATTTAAPAKALSKAEREEAELSALFADLARLKLTAADFPEKFICPLTQEPFKDPVIADDASTYERAAILECFATTGKKSPLTGEALESTDVTPNLPLRSEMKAYRDRALAAK